ncbi:unnamed protein product [Clonostachys rosea]|uniref:Uncharacterized protein n=1 Tax=Bionectria ochroleuca TaxID=29856 RepID=A0ABY6UCW1_BIOOC|nr:unnamed protein product [Clonostachys rosea]
MSTNELSTEPAPARTSYRKRLAELRESKLLKKELVIECAKSLLPQEPAYIMAINNWHELSKVSRYYLAKALGPDEDFEFIDDHLTLATEPTESSGIDCHFQELVAAGILKPLCGPTNGAVFGGVARREVHHIGTTIHSPTVQPSQSPVYDDTGRVHPPYGSSNENPNKRAASANFFGQVNPPSNGSPFPGRLVENSNKRQALGSGGGLFGGESGTGQQSSGRLFAFAR